MNANSTDEITTYYLEMLSAESLKPAPIKTELAILECTTRQYQYNRFLYQLVGEQWQWHDKLAWSAQQWQEYAEADNLRTWVAYQQGSPAGYFELQFQAEGNVEIAYFGLAAAFIGKGYGGYLLTQALNQAWRGGARRVWVHTCNLDHPNALTNYQKRGMLLYRTCKEVT